MHDRTRTHDARLERHIQFAFRQTIVAQRLCRRAQRLHFGMSRRVVAADWTVVPNGNHLSVANDDGTHRHLSLHHRGTGLLQRQAHVGLVGGG